MASSSTYIRLNKSNLFAEWFLNSVGVLLLTFAIVLGWCNIANSGLMSPHDAISTFTLRTLFWIILGLFVTVSLICFAGKASIVSLISVAWLAFFVEMFQLALLFNASRAIHASFGYISLYFNLPSGILQTLAEGAFLYFLAGSFLLMGWFWCDHRKAQALLRQMLSGEMLKCHCHACGGHIMFSAVNLGEKVICPHCQANITLRKPNENLKVSCFFCQEYIAFPAHAIGTTLKCPHCSKQITLKDL